MNSIAKVAPDTIDTGPESHNYAAHPPAVGHHSMRRESLAFIENKNVSLWTVFRPNRRDFLNIGLIAVAVVAVLLILSPARSFVINDDWCYAQSVDAMLKGAYRPHEYSMATAIGHIGWGALVQLVLGTGFTTLSLANLAMSVACLASFYLLMRHLTVPAAWSMLGVTALGTSPMFVYLGYSFMTDISFVTYSLIALLCCVRAVQHAKAESDNNAFANTKKQALRIDVWLLAGSIFATLSYLTRQLGLIIPIVVLLYIWWSKIELSWRRVFTVSALPAGAAVAFTVWQNSYPLSAAAYLESTVRADNFRHIFQFLGDRLTTICISLFLIGFVLLPFIRINRQSKWFFVLLGLLLAIEWPVYTNYGTFLPQDYGNIISNKGMLIQNYSSPQLFPEWFWTIANIVSLAVIALFAGKGLSYFRTRMQAVMLDLRKHTPDPLPQNASSIPDNNTPAPNLGNNQKQTTIEKIKLLIARRPELDPAWLLYGFAVAIVIPTAILSYALFDRYWLPAIPAVLLLAIRANIRHSQKAPGLARWLILLPIMAFSLLNQQDFMATLQARWEAGRNLIQTGVPINQIYAGPEWAGWYLADEGAAYFHSDNGAHNSYYPPLDVTDPVYIVDGNTYEGYDQISSTTYHSWLRSNGQILVLKEQGR